MSRPWMPLYVADYLADTTHLGAAESGAYLHLIMHYWQHGGLPDNDQALARIAKMTSREWHKARPAVQPFFQAGWKHKRVEAELKKTAEIGEAYAARARQAANKRWEKHSKSNAPSMPQASTKDCLVMPISPSQRKIPEEQRCSSGAIEDASSMAQGPSQTELEREFFRRGKQVCGKNAGGLLSSLLKSRQHDVALARAVVETAATKHDPREYVAAATRTNGHGKHRPGNLADLAFELADEARELERKAGVQRPDDPIGSHRGGR